MTITLAQLRSAAFWQDTVCLECAATAGDLGDECRECGSDLVFPAALVLEIVGQVDQEE